MRIDWTASDGTSEKFTSLTVFGDSLVDAGNYFINSGGTYPDAASAYFEGRNTNGYDYTDLLSQKLFGAPTAASGAGGANYAIGGAHTYEAAGQIAQYQQHLSGSATAVDPNGLYIVNFGGNDILYADTMSASDKDAYLMSAAQLYADAVQELNDIGARNKARERGDEDIAAAATLARAHLGGKTEPGNLEDLGPGRRRRVAEMGV
jgi:outer membrane lipase/esterase